MIILKIFFHNISVWLSHYDRLKSLMCALYMYLGEPSEKLISRVIDLGNGSGSL